MTFGAVPGFLVLCNVLVALSNVAAQELGILSPKTIFQLRFRTVLWVTLAGITFFSLILSLILAAEPDAPAMLRLGDTGTFVFVVLMFLGSSLVSINALFRHAWSLERPSPAKSRKGGDDETDGDVTLMELSILFVTELYQYPEPDKLRQLECQCAPCLPIDNLVAYLGKNTTEYTSKEEVNRIARQYIDDYIVGLKEDHAIHEAHVAGCEATGFSEAAQKQLALHLEDVKKRI